MFEVEFVLPTITVVDSDKSLEDQIRKSGNINEFFLSTCCKLIPELLHYLDINILQMVGILYVMYSKIKH